LAIGKASNHKKLCTNYHVIELCTYVIGITLLFSALPAIFLSCLGRTCWDGLRGCEMFWSVVRGCAGLEQMENGTWRVNGRPGARPERS